MGKIKVVVSGHFDPLHIGHIIHFKRAKALGDWLIVIVNSDLDCVRKKGFYLMPQCERIAIIKEFPFVDEVIPSIDTDGTIAKTLDLIRPNIFAKGANRTERVPLSPEGVMCQEINCQRIYGVGEKPPFHSSTDMIKNVAYNVLKEKIESPQKGEVYCIDIDGTLCDPQGGHYSHYVPRYEVIEKVNKLYNEGHIIKIFTGRGARTGIDWFELTKKQLEEWGVKYHELIMSKPHADYFIDDKAINITDWAK